MQHGLLRLYRLCAACTARVPLLLHLAVQL